MSRRALAHDAVRRVQDLILDVFGRVLPPDAETRLARILESIAAGAVPEGHAYSKCDVSVLVADLRGFAAITESYPAHLVLEVLNRCFGRMTEIVAGHHGVIDKFMGDAIMVLFSGDSGAPREHARRAVHCAVDMQIAMNELRSSEQSERFPELFLGIGINSGAVLAGLIGSDVYRAYTVIGSEVNLASRIEAYSLRGQILISQSTHERCRDFAEASEPMHVYMKGKTDGVIIREVKALPSLKLFVPAVEKRNSPRVDVWLPFAYYVLEGKTVMHEPMTGTILDLGYQGLLAEVAQSVPLYSEVRLELDLPSLAYRADDIYGRVVKVQEAGSRHSVSIEFTSLSRLNREKIELFVQMLIQERLAPSRFSGL